MPLNIKIVVFVGVLSLYEQAYGEVRQLDENDAQQVWNEYHHKLLNRRLAEVALINEQLDENDITSESNLILDFEFFSNREEGALNLKQQLSENYQMELRKGDGYWYVSGTTRPYAMNITFEQHKSWVEFMFDVGQSHGCIFSTWSVTDHSTKKVWSNENVETEFD